MPKPQGNSRYMPGLDGLRAIAVLAVIAYHLQLSFAPGGLLGVGVFFVLSGYLITDLLVAQWKRTGRLDLKDFWIRRARRLLPGLLLMLIVVIAWVTLFARSELWTLRGDALAAMLYISNWWLIFHHVSYFASFGPPSPLGHLWSLAVEEQFYLLWPLLLGANLYVTQRRGWLIALAVTLATASALAMAILYQPGTDPSRVYYGTDTRAFALLIGAVLAFAWPSHKLTDKISRKARWAIDLTGSIGLCTILFMMWKTNEYQAFLYRGGLVVLSLATALTVLALVHPASLLAKALGWKPLRWLGVRSYGIYLWHYPVIVLTTPSVNTEGLNPTRALLQVAASIALAALSWKFIEDPIRRGALGSLWKQIRSGNLRALLVQRRGWFTAMGALIPLSIAGVGIAMPLSAPTGQLSAVTTLTPTASTSSSAGDGPVTSNQSGTPAATTPGSGGHGQAATNPGAISYNKMPANPDSSGTKVTGPTSTNGNTPGTTATPGTSSVPSSALPPAAHMADSNPTRVGTVGSESSQSTSTGTGSSGYGSNSSTVTPQSGQGMTAIGDSVMIDISPYLKQLFPGIVIDAQVGRQLTQVPSVVQQLKAEGNLGSRVVILEIGTNGPFSETQLISVLHSLGNVQHVVLINTREPRPWESVVNSTLAKVAAAYPNTTLVNWYAASAGKNSLFYPDGVHLNPQGAQYYANLVAETVDAQTN